MSTNLYQSESQARTEPQNRKLYRLKARRQRWLTMHLWLGLTLGLLLSIYGITGSILVFYAEIEEVESAGYAWDVGRVDLRLEELNDVRLT